MPDGEEDPGDGEGGLDVQVWDGEVREEGGVAMAGQGDCVL